VSLLLGYAGKRDAGDANTKKEDMEVLRRKHKRGRDTQMSRQANTVTHTHTDTHTHTQTHKHTHTHIHTHTYTHTHTHTHTYTHTQVNLRSLRLCCDDQLDVTRSKLTGPVCIRGIASVANNCKSLTGRGPLTRFYGMNTIGLHVRCTPSSCTLDEHHRPAR